jgi:hypothetical protein
MFLVPLVLLGCMPSDTAEGDAATDEPSGPPPEEEFDSVNIVYQLLTYAEVETDGDTREFERSFTLPIGEPVTRIGEAFPGVTPFGDRTLVKIRNSVGEEAYALDRYIVPGASLGVVVDDQAVLYTRPNLVSPTDDIIPRGEMVAIHDDSTEGDFVHITTYDHALGVPYFGLYVKREDISSDDVDVQAGLLLFVAQRTGAEVAKRELLENAESLGNSAFVDDVRRELAVLRGEDPEDAMPAELTNLAIEKFGFDGVINTDGTTVYRYPDKRSEFVETTLSEGALVRVEERTVEAFEVDGETSSWFRITSPAGWVFGAYIDPE